MDRRKVYTDIAVMAAGFAVLGFLGRIPYLYGLSAAILLLSVHPRMAYYISFYWGKFGKALGWVNSRILLSFFFVFFITPTAWLYRLRNRKNRQPESGWTDAPGPVDFTKPW